MTFVSSVVVFLIVAFFLAAIRVYILLRDQSNRSIKLAVSEFHSVAESMLRTPQDLPDEVLRAIHNMNYLAFAAGSDRRFYETLRRERQGKLPEVKDRSLPQAIVGMRPELRDLFSKLASAWFTILSNRHVLIGAMIHFEMQAMQLRTGSVTKHGVVEAEAIKVLPSLQVAPQVPACAA